jgi:hypothetical protein
MVCGRDGSVPVAREVGGHAAGSRASGSKSTSLPSKRIVRKRAVVERAEVDAVGGVARGSGRGDGVAEAVAAVLDGERVERGCESTSGAPAARAICAAGLCKARTLVR